MSSRVYTTLIITFLHCTSTTKKKLYTNWNYSTKYRYLFFKCFDNKCYDVIEWTCALAIIFHPSTKIYKFF